jgi:hypothetical protein
VNVTMTGTVQPSWFSVFPSGQAWPGTSNVNSIGPTTANLAWIPVSASGSIDVRNGPGAGHVVIDIIGWTYQ